MVPPRVTVFDAHQLKIVLSANFVFLPVSCFHPLAFVVLGPVQLDGKQRLFGNLVVNHKVEPPRVEQVVTAKVLSENVRNGHFFGDKTLSAVYSHVIQRMIQALEKRFKDDWPREWLKARNIDLDDFTEGFVPPKPHAIKTLIVNEEE